jgi:hypothetical protein
MEDGCKFVVALERPDTPGTVTRHKYGAMTNMRTTVDIPDGITAS